MKLLISGEGPTDLGACNNAQGQCSDENLNRGPMAVWLARLFEERFHYNLLDMPEAVIYVSKTALNQKSKQSGKRLQTLRSKNKSAETGFYYNNAFQLGIMAKELSVHNNSVPVMAVLFRDADGTQNAQGQHWQTKWDSILYGFSASSFEFGVPMVPKPKSEVWLLCAGKSGSHSCHHLENVSGNDDSPNSAKNQLDKFFGDKKSAAQLSEWAENNPENWDNLLTMPSFKAFYERFKIVADDILKSTTMIEKAGV